MLKLAQKVVLVTGGGAGIGRAIALAFAEQGAAVAVADIRAEAAEATCKLAGSGAVTRAFQVDMRAGPAVQELVSGIVEQFGALHVVVNNAGAWRLAAPIDLIPDDDWDALIAVNLRATFLGMKYTIPVLREHAPGAIINIASLAGSVPHAGSGAYCSAKAAVAMLTRVAALENLALGVRVNSISPGSVDSPGARAFIATGDSSKVTEGDRPVRGRFTIAPEAIARAAVYLASEDSLHVTGHDLVVDQGLGLQTFV